MPTLTEAGARLGLAATTLRVQIRNRKLTGTLVGKTYVVTDEEVERYRAASRGKPGRHAATSRDAKS